MLHFGYVAALFGGGLLLAVWLAVAVLRAHPSAPDALLAPWLLLVLGVSYLAWRLTSWRAVELVYRLDQRLGHGSKGGV